MPSSPERPATGGAGSHDPAVGTDSRGWGTIWPPHSWGRRHVRCMSYPRRRSPTTHPIDQSFPAVWRAWAMRAMRRRFTFVCLAFLDDTLADLEGILDEV